MKTKRISTSVLCLLLAGIMLLSCTSCAMQISAAELSKDYERKATETGEVSEAFKTAMADFSMTLFKGILTKDGENDLVSPLSAVICLAMIANGADGETKAQMEAAFGMDVDTLNRSLYAYTSSLYRAKDCKLNLADSIWFRDEENRLHVNESFLQANADWYDAQIYAAPFDQSTLKDINTWCKQHTDGMIEKLLDELDTDAQMILINALTFDAKWKTKYESDAISKQYFTALNGEKTKVSFQKSTESLYISTEQATGFLKPYDGEKFSFLALLPNEGVDFEEYLSSLTGESLPRDVKEGDEIISGCIDMSGVLKIRTTKAFGESTVSKILDLVENASSRKSRSEAFISRFAKIYTPAVCAAALALAVLVPLGRMLAGLDANWTDWIYRALSFLVVSCPCALVISIPLSFFAGIGGASKEGILIKGSNYLEALSEAKIVVFDKTGTLTRGVFEVTAVHHSPMDEAQLLEYAALAECASSHPISKSLQKAYGKEIDRSRVTDIEELSGHGITATVDGHAVAAGNSKLMNKLGVEYHDCHSTGTIIHMAVDGQYAGHIVISDVVKPHSKEAIEQLKRAGVQKTVMLTGDAKRVADSVAAELGVDEVRSELLPGDKVAEVEKLLAAKSKKDMLAFVGDGINDAPVLTRADIGIAMGAMGSDAAIEAADIVLMDDDPLQIAKAIKISRKCIGIVRQNIVFSLVVKFGCLALVAFGVANMWAAIFADVGVMVLAVLNAIRALRYRS